MAQKVITVTGHATSGEGKGSFAELRFPKVNAAIADGYEIKQIHNAQLTNSHSNTLCWLALTFVLEKPTPTIKRGSAPSVLV